MSIKQEDIQMTLSRGVTTLVYGTIPIANSQISKGNDLKFRLDSKIIDMGLNGYRDIAKFPELMKEFEVMDSTFKYLTKIGYSTLKSEDYERMVNDIKVKQTKLNTKK